MKFVGPFFKKSFIRTDTPLKKGGYSKKTNQF
ncbi:hypothetical protein BC643_3847 [Mangrovibacterium diazotrophicum]|uniref:Uncharacterized protein n=1 Tax=Mangrovibacterium diazotrophicum TaxID=1261403 RepID=A0A419VXN0_9BACT|nr:hypothetical protein BC643_3847 [Mangrovibacterium diazotrophicum]